jgi:translation initiation factor 1
MGKRDKKDEAPAAPAGPFNNPFAALSAKRDALPQAPAAPVAPPSAKPEPKGPARAVVRMERKGRGGKEVTVVEHLELPAPQREVWLKALKNSLGCGGVVEDDALVLQGDQRERLPALLEARGVRKVTVG